MEAENKHKRSGVGVKSAPVVMPPPVSRVLGKLGDDLALARRRRRLSQASMAERTQTSVATLRRLERGDPRIPIGLIARVLFVLGDLDKLDALLDTARDDIGLLLMNQQVPKRVRQSKNEQGSSGAL
jgi:transcriptional regulator with XRE-family HTH domain